MHRIRSQEPRTTNTMPLTETLTRISTSLSSEIRNQLRNQFVKKLENATPDEIFRATASALRPYLVDGMMRSAARLQTQNAKAVYYLSMEFLLGRSLSNNLLNLSLYSEMETAFGDLGLRLSDILEVESDAALGNGGLGRLAACYLDSLASLGMPGYGYGINYEYGLFRQEIEDGFQIEKPDFWASAHSPWLIEHLDQAYVIPVYGRIEHGCDRNGGYNPMWLDWLVLVGVPHDLPIVGQHGDTINFLRLFSARASDDFDISIFNSGDYLRAVERKMQSETVSKVLYPSDASAAGKELRLVQEYFLVACAMRDILKRFFSQNSDPRQLPSKAAIQLNDTHPALTVAELMRTLVDEYDVPWEEAWTITQSVCGYTNHTLMPEALEKWSVDLIERVLPRHLQIIYEINRRFLEQVATTYPGDSGKLERMSLIEEGPQRKVRMANLSIVGSHAVNGVAALHSDLVKSDLVPDFHEFFPGRFSNKTNGVTPRRWLRHANPGLSAWITDRIGENWHRDLNDLRKLEAHAQESESQRQFMAVKRANKQRLAKVIWEQTGLRVDPTAMFDVQVKRIHEYKRQLLHVLNVIDEYFSIVEDGHALTAPRVHIFAGKAAPGYYKAKLIIKLINNVARVINADPRTHSSLKMAYLPDYRVSLAESIIPGADLSEQISTAGTEASGTSNMKFALNGALTIGTLDGANVEMLEEAGAENIFIFGHTTPEVKALRASGYNSAEWSAGNPRINRILNAIRSNRFSASEHGIFDSICQGLLNDGDHYLHIADFAAYVETQESVSRVFTDPSLWSSKCILNVARMGKFSSDRSIQEYASEIWGIQSLRR
ncbi:MAG: glycogen/starch/alpha-glucan phosphorylase [Bryobacteraceae bacterium]